VLFDGHYSGAMEPMAHYIPLHKDFSNFDEVMELIRDPQLRRELVENAHRDLIASGEWSYGRLIAQLDGVLADAGLRPTPAPTIAVKLARGAHLRSALTDSRWWLAHRLKPFMDWLAPFTGRVRKFIGRPRPAPHT
jgi:hypothetical protein